MKGDPLGTPEKVENMIEKRGEEFAGELENAERVNDLKGRMMKLEKRAISPV